MSHLTMYPHVKPMHADDILYVLEVVTQPKILNQTILYNLVHVTKIFFAL